MAGYGQIVPPLPGEHGYDLIVSAEDDPARVAKDGFEALLAGKDHVIAGSARNKARVAGSRFLPEQARATLHAAQTKPRDD